MAIERLNALIRKENAEMITKETANRIDTMENFKRKGEKCKEFFDTLCRDLEKTHVVVGSCNLDSSIYLIPKGTENEITYYSKPENSFRLSDHWNWFANLNKCDIEHYVQCYSVDMPFPNRRKEKGKASKPKIGWQVSYFGNDKKYHCIYGEKYNRNKREWSFVEADVNDVVASLI